MCARRGSQGVKPEAQDAGRAPLPVWQIGAYFFLDMIIFSPSNMATTERSSGVAPRASAQGFGIVTRQLIEPDPAFANIKFNSRFAGLSLSFIISLLSCDVATIFIKRLPGRPSVQPAG